MDKTTNQIIFECLNPSVCWHEYDPNRKAWIKDYFLGVFSQWVSNPDANLCIKCGRDAGIPLQVNDEPLLSTAINVPDYENDLNAVREAELKAIEEFGRSTYIAAVRKIIEPLHTGGTWMFHLIDAPASVRAQAVRKLVEENNG